MIECVKIIILGDHWNETKDQSTLEDLDSGMTVDLTKLPEHGIIVNVPSGSAHLGMASEKKGLFRSCDNLILIEHNDCIDIYFIEMKESLGQKQKESAASQILHTIPIWDYIVSMVNIHFNRNKKTNSYFTIIAKRSSHRLDKQKVKSEFSEIFPYGDKQFKIIYSVSEIPFKFLQ